MRKKIVKGCIIFMLLGLTGCGEANEVEPYGGVEETEADTTEVTEASTTEEEEAEEVTEAGTENNETETTQAENPDAGEISDDLYSYQIIINGELYQIPMDVKDLLDDGWEFEEDVNEELDAYTYNPVLTFNKGDYNIQVNIVNETENPRPYSECKIVGVLINLYYNSGNDMTFILPKGIQSNVSTVEDMKAAYGEPTDFSESDGMAFATYEEEFASKEVKLTFDGNKLIDIEINNEDY